MALDMSTVKGQAQRAVKAFSPAQLVIAGLLAVVGVVAAAMFFRWISAPSYGVLYTNLSAKDAASVTTKLQSAGVPYKLEAGGATILVPTSSIDQQRVALAADGTVTGGTTGWELIDKQGLTTSSFRQQVDYQRALEGELSRTLASVGGVNSAQVHLVLPQERLFQDQQRPARASVLLDTSGRLPQDQVEAVISLVSSSVPELDPTAVTVTDSQGRLLSGTGSQKTSELQERQVYEDTVTSSAQGMLDQLLGPGHAVVRVSADLDFATHTTDTETYDPTKTATLDSTKSEETFKGSGDPSSSNGQLTVSNTGSGTSSGTGTNNYTKKSEQQSYGVNRVVDHGEHPGGTVKRLTVAVAVDSNAKGVPPTTQLQQLVGNAVGLDTTRGDSIVVSATAFDTSAAAGTTTTKKATGGLAAAGTSKTVTTGVAGLVLLVVTFLLARSVRRPKVTELDVSSYPALTGSGPLQIPAQRAALTGTQHALPAGGSGSANPSDVLNAVETQPDDVANLLRGWLADTGSQR